MEFKVNGVTFENEDGNDIQRIIKKEIRELKESGLINEKYEGYSNKEIKEMDLNVQEYSDITFDVKIKEAIFEDKPCVKIYIEKNNGDYVHIGYLPKKLLKEYNLYKEDAINITGTAELVGGKYKHCICYEEDYEEKTEVETIELDYGLLVNLNFEYEKEEQIQNIEKQDNAEEIQIKNNQDSSKYNEIGDNNTDKENEKIKTKQLQIYKKWWFWVILAIILLAII